MIAATEMAKTGVRMCLVGATGLVGSTLMAEAVGRDDVRLVGVGRREADGWRVAKEANPLGDDMGPLVDAGPMRIKGDN